MISILVLTAKIFVTASFLFSYNSPEVFAEISSRKIIELTNQSRQNIGVDPLSENPFLTRAAYQKAQDMLDRNYFNHEDPDGNMPWYWLKNNNYIYSYAGENLAMDFSRAESVHEAWLNSESHRANIENPNYREIGIAVVHGKMNGKNTTVLVEFFGTTFASQTENITSPIDSNTAASPLATNIEADKLNPQMKSAQVTAEIKAAPNNGFLDFLGRLSNNFYWAFLIILTMTLLVNIFVKIRIQHKPAIMQTISVLILISAAIFVHTHFLENIPKILQII
jgi:uncharacterized protein YkwD